MKTITKFFFSKPKSLKISQWKLFIFCSLTVLPFGAKAQWLEQITGFNASHQCLTCVNSQTCYLGGWDGLLLKTVDGSNWFDASNGITKTGNVINTIYTIDAQTVLASSQNHLYRTENGGSNWNEITIPINGLSFFNFISQSTGYAAAQSEILKTTYGGMTWQILSHNLPLKQNVNVGLLSFKNNVGHAVIHDIPAKRLYIYKSIDEGLSWKKTFDDSLISPSRDMKFPSEAVGYVCGATNGYLLKTSDSGETWSLIDNPYSSSAEGYLALDFIDPLNGYLVGPQGVFVKTKTGGASWIVESYMSASPFIDVSIADAQTVYACGEGNLLAKNGFADLANLEENQLNLIEIIYPNPSLDEINLHLNQWRENLTFCLFDLSGKEILVLPINNIDQQIRYNNLSLGSYIYTIKENQVSISTGKIMLN